MNVSKILISTAAAVTVAGAVGFAYAQTGTYDSNSSGATNQNRTARPTVPNDTKENQEADRAASGSRSSENMNDSTGNANDRANDKMMNKDSTSNSSSDTNSRSGIRRNETNRRNETQDEGVK